jgi:hypothetical protein
MEEIISKLKVKPQNESPRLFNFDFNIFGTRNSDVEEKENDETRDITQYNKTENVTNVLKNVKVTFQDRKFNRDDFLETLYMTHKNKVINNFEEKVVTEMSMMDPIAVTDEGSSVSVPVLDSIDEEPKVILLRRVNRKVTVQLSEADLSDDFEETLTDEVENVGELENMIAQLPDRVEPENLMRASSYYLNNRKIFIEQMNQMISNYKNVKNKETISCSKTKDNEFNLLPHQHIVREYLNVYSPYRGLLLYHGLGSGKTCSSIAIAEGLKTDREIIVMTPKSLKMNYVEELKYCGDVFHKKTQYWYFLSYEQQPREVISNLSSHLHVSEDVIDRNKGLWVVQKDKQSNYDTLSGKQRLALERQLNDMIQHKYKFIHYNGIRHDKLDILSQNRTINPFDNKVIVVDEAHNLVSRIVNQLMKKKKLTPEDIEKSISLRLYNYMLMAENCKVVFLSGTPIINYPLEIGVMFNILRGYIHTWTMKLRINVEGKVVNTDYFKQLFRDISVMDYIDYVPSTSTLTVTRNPYGFINDPENLDRKKVDENGNIHHSEFSTLLRNKLETNGFTIEDGSYKHHKNKALPDSNEAFAKSFIRDDKFFNDITLKRRIMGLASYFRSAQERLMPRFDPNTDIVEVMCEMSEEQFTIYNEARHVERKQEMRRRMKKGDEGSSTYRIFSRLYSNFVFPATMKRPLPNEKASLEENIANNKKLNEDIVDNIPVEQQVENVEGPFDVGEEQEAIKDVNDVIDSNYKTRIDAALQFLQKNAGTYLTKSALKNYSPKFLAILENIQKEEHTGLHLLYSQFRTLEGIGIFKLVLEQNGYAEFSLTSSGSGWQFSPKEEDLGKPTFVLYTGTETDEYKELVRNIFNGNWDVIPSNLREDLMKSFTSNKNGEVIKLFMITQSGAEGISLKNVKYVHIMEPYWHPVRETQIIGRARRICSHEELPEKDRFVKVFKYISTLKEAFLQGPEASELLQHDQSKELINGNREIYTTDQALDEISKIKKRYNDAILKAVKESSIDCTFNVQQSFGEGEGGEDANPEDLKCFSFGSTTSDQIAFAPFFEQEERDETYNQNVINQKMKFHVIDVKGTKYAMRLDENNKPMNEFYDYNSYLYTTNTDPNAQMERVANIQLVDGKIRIIKKKVKRNKKVKDKVKDNVTNKTE